MDITHVQLGGGEAAVFTPTEPVILNLAQAEVWERTVPAMGPFDRAVLQGVRNAPDRHQAVIFRGKQPGGEGCYRFVEGLSEPDADRIAYQIFRHTMGTFRALIRLGVRGIYHVNWEPTDISALQRAKDRYVAEREGDPDLRRLDSFILRRAVFFVFSDLERALERFIPNTMNSIERDARTLERLLAATADGPKQEDPSDAAP